VCECARGDVFGSKNFTLRGIILLSCVSRYLIVAIIISKALLRDALFSIYIKIKDHTRENPLADGSGTLKAEKIIKTRAGF